jgi:hypothetical protein
MLKKHIKMQSNSLYLYQNKTDVQLSDNTQNRRNIVVYAANLVLHKDVDNALFFQFKNSDFDERTAEQQILFELPLTIIDATTGKASVTVPEQFLYHVETGKYEYAITSLELDGTKRPTYVDDNLGMRGVVDIKAGASPIFKASEILTFDSQTDMTDVVSGLTQVHNNNALHTVLMKFTTFTGDMTIQATMDNIMQQTTNVTWFDVATFNYVAQDDNVTLNFNGVFSGVRFVQAVTTGTIDELQYRF